MTLFHVEVQEVVYRTYAVEAEDKKAAVLAAPDVPDVEVGHRLVSILPTNTHEVSDACAKRDCYKQPDGD